MVYRGFYSKSSRQNFIFTHTEAWKVSPCSLVEINRCFVGSYCLHPTPSPWWWKHFWNVGQFTPHYTAQYPTTQSLPHSPPREPEISHKCILFYVINLLVELSRITEYPKTAHCSWLPHILIYKTVHLTGYKYWLSFRNTACLLKWKLRWRQLVGSKPYLLTGIMNQYCKHITKRSV
jgi:hypothetical protein